MNRSFEFNMAGMIFLTIALVFFIFGVVGGGVVPMLLGVLAGAFGAWLQVASKDAEDSTSAN